MNKLALLFALLSPFGNLCGQNGSYNNNLSLHAKLEAAGEYRIKNIQPHRNIGA